MKTVLVIIFSIFLIGCKNHKKEICSEQMDLGKALFELKSQEFYGDSKKIDSAYKADKERIINEVYR